MDRRKAKYTSFIRTITLVAVWSAWYMINEYPQNDDKQRGKEGKTKTADFI